MFGTLIKKGAGRGSEGISVMAAELSFSEVGRDALIASSTSGCAEKFLMGGNWITYARTDPALTPTIYGLPLLVRTPYGAQPLLPLSTLARTSLTAGTPKSSLTQTHAVGAVAQSADAKPFVSITKPTASASFARGENADENLENVR